MNILIDSKNNAYVEINPIRVSITNTFDCTRLYVSSENDNLNNQVTLLYRLTDERGIQSQGVATRGNIIMDGIDYTNWDGSNTFPFTFIASKFGLSIS